MIVPAFIISVLALTFTLASFWWLHWRTGKLRIAEPRTYQGYAQTSGQMILVIPLVFFNDGPTPILVSNLRLRFLHETDAQPLTFNSTWAAFAYKEEDLGRAFATPFPVHGREATLRICEFQRELAGWEFQAKQYWLGLDAKIGTPGRWKQVSKFCLGVSKRAAETMSRQLLMHDSSGCPEQ